MDRRLLGVEVRNHPVILSELRNELPVLDLGFWVVERGSLPSEMSLPAGSTEGLGAEAQPCAPKGGKYTPSR
jgi:hypothetical protein